MKLQLCLLDPPLDQLVEGSDVGELFNLSPKLVMLNPRPEMRRISFVVEAIFAQERNWSGLMGPSPCVSHLLDSSSDCVCA